MLNGYKIVGLCITRAYEESNYNFIKEFNELLTQNGARLFIFHSCTGYFGSLKEELGERRVFETMPFGILDAVVVYEETFDDRKVAAEVIELCLNCHIPTYVIGDYYEGTKRFSFDYVRGFEKVVRHMIEEHAYRNPYFLGGIEGNDYSDARERIYANVLEENGFSFDKSKVGYGYFWYNPAYEVVSSLVEENRDSLPDAIICANDSMAIAAVEALKDKGIRVPEEVAVSGFDGIRNIYLSNPQITSCKCSEKALAKAIWNAIETAREGENGIEEEVLVLPELVTLHSCGCMNAATANPAETISILNNRLGEYMLREQKLIAMASRLQFCNSIDEINEALKHPWMEETSILLTPESLDDTFESLYSVHNEIPETYICVFDNDGTHSYHPQMLGREKVLPRIAQSLEHEAPIIFNALAMYDGLIGLFVDHSKKLDQERIYAIPQIVSALKIGFFGYQKKAHQELLSTRMLDLYKTDALTEFFQRKALNFEYSRFLDKNKTDDCDICIMLVDVDALKTINDVYGHNEGDCALIAVADALRTVTPRGTALFRYGGDEMLAIFEREGDPEAICNNLRGLVEEYNKMANKPYYTEVSIGIVSSEEMGTTDLKALIHQADEMMYAEKSEKRK